MRQPLWQGWYRPPGQEWWKVLARGDSYAAALAGLTAQGLDLRYAQVLRWGTTPRDGCESCLGPSPRKPSPRLAARARQLLPHLTTPRGVRELAALLKVGPKGCRRMLAYLDAAGLAECRGTGTRVCWVATAKGLSHLPSNREAHAPFAAPVRAFLVAPFTLASGGKEWLQLDLFGPPSAPRRRRRRRLFCACRR